MVAVPCHANKCRVFLSFGVSQFCSFDVVKVVGKLRAATCGLALLPPGWLLSGTWFAVGGESMPVTEVREAASLNKHLSRFW